jgi:hypothetical protein
MGIKTQSGNENGSIVTLEKKGGKQAEQKSKNSFRQNQIRTFCLKGLGKEIDRK